MEARWELVLCDAAGTVLARQAELEAHGIPTFIPSMNVKLADPTISGGNCFDWELQVPASALEAAQSLLRERARTGREALGESGAD